VCADHIQATEFLVALLCFNNRKIGLYRKSSLDEMKVVTLPSSQVFYSRQAMRILTSHMHNFVFFEVIDLPFTSPTYLLEYIEAIVPDNSTIPTYVGTVNILQSSRQEFFFQTALTS